MSSISVCMIVKNEEELLPQCLDSIVDIADELIIVDTGSGDRTMQIARDYNADLYEFEWTDSFSDARNFSIDLATKEWILWIDADEELESADILLLAQAVQNPDCDGIICQMLNDRSDGWAMHRLEKFFRRGSARFFRRKHNQLMGTQSRVYLPIRFYHYGYNLSPQKMKEKYARDIALLKMELGENDKDVQIWRNLIRTYRAAGEWDTLIETANRLDTMLKLDHTMIMAGGSEQLIDIDLAEAYKHQYEYDSAAGILRKLLIKHPDNIDANFMLAEVWFLTDKYLLAIESYIAYLRALGKAKAGGQIGELIIDTWGYEYMAYNNMAICYQETGQSDQAFNALRIAALQNMEANLIRFYKFHKKDKVRSSYQLREEARQKDELIAELRSQLEVTPELEIAEVNLAGQMDEKE